MRESIHKYFQVGLIVFMKHPNMAKGEDPNTLEYIQLVACDDYFDAIEVNWIKDDETRGRVAHLLEQAHMTVCYGDMHQRFGFPQGSNDTREVLDFLRVLKGEGFLNARDPMVLSFEVRPWKEEDPEAVIAGAKRVLNRAWALLED